MRIFLLAVCLLLPLSSQAASFPEKVGQTAPDFVFSTSRDAIHRITDFRGKWLLLQFGGTWCPPSETTAEFFSRMRRALKGKPFEFVEVYEDPTLADVDTFSLTKFSGLRAVTDEENLPKFYRVGSIPIWFLINPNGVVEAVGQFETAPHLQKMLTTHLSGAKGFSGVSLTPSAGEAQREKAMDLYFRKRKDRQAHLAAWEGVLKTDPTDARAICGKARALAWIKGWSAANQYLRETLATQKDLPDSVRIFAVRYGMNDSHLLPTVQLLATLAHNHPKSVYLQAWNLVWTKPPQSLTSEDLEVSKQSYRIWNISGIDQYLAICAERNGRLELAAKLFHEDDQSGRDLLDSARLRRLQGDDAAALQLVGPAKGNYTRTTANPAQAWHDMLRYTAIADWPQVAAFAKRYTQVRPKKAQGLLFQWLAALRRQKSAEARTLQDTVQKFLSTSPRYAATRPLLKKNPTRDDFLRISNDHIRFDSALAAMLLAEADGHPEKAIQIASEAERAFRPDYWCTTILRAAEPPTPKLSPENPASRPDGKN